MSEAPRKAAVREECRRTFHSHTEREVFCCLWSNSQEVARNPLLSDAFPVTARFTGQFVAVLFPFKIISIYFNSLSFFALLQLNVSASDACFYANHSSLKQYLKDYDTGQICNYLHCLSTFCVK